MCFAAVNVLFFHASYKNLIGQISRTYQLPPCHHHAIYNQSLLDAFPRHHLLKPKVNG